MELHNANAVQADVETGNVQAPKNEQLASDEQSEVVEQRIHKVSKITNSTIILFT